MFSMLLMILVATWASLNCVIVCLALLRDTRLDFESDSRKWRVYVTTVGFRTFSQVNASSDWCALDSPWMHRCLIAHTCICCGLFITSDMLRWLMHSGVPIVASLIKRAWNIYNIWSSQSGKSKGFHGWIDMGDGTS